MNMRLSWGLCLLLCALASAACYTLKPVSLDQLNVRHPDRVWVTGADQSVVVVSTPQIVGDRLVGNVNGRQEEMPNVGLKQVRVRTLAPERTALLAVGIAAGVGAFFAWAFEADRPQYIPYCGIIPETPPCP